MIRYREAVPQAELGYRILGIAEKMYNCTPAHLDDSQRSEAERIARRQIDLERRILSSSEAVNVVVQESQVNEAVDRIRARYASEEDFQRELADNSLDEQQFRSSLQQELRVDAIMERIAAKTAPIDDTEIRLYYYMHPEQFQQPETRLARHILITVNPEFPENRPEMALRRAQEIARRVLRKPDRFAEQAAKHSECPTALQGGQVGRVKRGMLYPELDKALFAMREGAVSDVVESDVGYHIVYCEKIYPEGTAPLAEVLPKLRESMQAKAAGRNQRRWIETLYAADSGKVNGGKTNNS